MKAASNYRQIRITLTEQPGHRATVRILVKPLHEAWHHKQLVIAKDIPIDTDLSTLGRVYAALLEALCEQPLPESLG